MIYANRTDQNIIYYYQKKIQRVKAAKSLYSINDKRITKYKKQPLIRMLASRQYHSPEINKTDDDNQKSIIAVYDYSW